MPPTTYPIGRTCVTRQKLRLGLLSETDLLILGSPFPATKRDIQDVKKYRRTSKPLLRVYYSLKKNNDNKV